MFFIDIQGTLISDEDKSPLPGAIEFIRWLNQTSTPYLLITNNTKQASQEFLASLQKRGFPVDLAHYIDPLMVLQEFLPPQKVAAYGTEEFLQNLLKLGYTLDFNSPQSVLVAIKKEFTNDEYADMIEFLLGGAKLVGMHETSIYAKDAKRYPGVGAILQLLSFATRKNYEVVGKPSELFYTKALQKLQKQNSQVAFDTITIISDDVTGDLVGAKKLGMHTIFVTSGKFRNAEEILPSLGLHEQPDRVLKNIGEMLVARDERVATGEEI